MLGFTFLSVYVLIVSFNNFSVTFYFNNIKKSQSSIVFDCVSCGLARVVEIYYLVDGGESRRPAKIPYTHLLQLLAKVTNNK